MFGNHATYAYLDDRFEAGAVVKRTPLTKEFDLTSYHDLYGADAIPLFLIDEKRQLHVFDVDNPPQPKTGHVIIGLVDPVTSPASRPQAAELPEEG